MQVFGAGIPDPFAKVGHQLSARSLNNMARAVRRVNVLPDSFISSVFNLQARGGGSGASQTVQVVLMVAYTDIDAATGNLADGITPGKGLAKHFETNVITDPEDPDYGKRTLVEPPIEVFNYDPGAIYEENTGIYVGVVPGSPETLIEVFAAFCSPYLATAPP